MISIVTDSTACLTQQDAKRLGVQYLSNAYSINGIGYTESFTDFYSGDIDKILQNGEHMRTSQVSTMDFIRAFTTLREMGSEVLCITMSSRLSGNFNNAWVCARHLEDAKVETIDSSTIAGGLMILLEEARKMIDAGMSLSDISEEIRQLSKKIHIGFSVDDMTPLRKSGRLGPVRQSIGTILNVKPILSCEDGRIISKKVVRGNRERLRELLSMVPDDADSVIVMEFGNKEAQQYLARSLRVRCKCEVLERSVGPVLGIHLGQGSVGIAWLKK